MKFIRATYGSLLVLFSTPITAFAQPGQNYPADPYVNSLYQNSVPPSLLNNSYGGGYSFPGANLPPLNAGGSYGRGISRVGGSGGGFYALLDVGYKLIGYFQVIIFFVALVYLLRGAFLFTQGKEKEASPMILNAVIGIVVALLAFAVIPLICSVTGAGGEACTVGR